MAEIRSHAQGPDTLTGSGEADSLYGGRADDHLYGAGGDDLLNGEDGNDTLSGGAGNDTLYGYFGTDTVTYADAPSNVRASLERGYATIGVDTDTLHGIEALIGSPLADHLEGSGDDNTLQGEAGNDTLDGQGGSDTLAGGTGADKFVLSCGALAIIADFSISASDRLDLTKVIARLTGKVAANPFESHHLRLYQDARGARLDVDLDGGDDGAWTPIAYLLGVAGASLATTTLVGGHAPVLAGPAPGGAEIVGTMTSDTLIGTAGVDILQGLGGVDTLQGGDGDDSLLGGQGADSIDGGPGHDILRGQEDFDVLCASAGSDVLDGGEGSDIANYAKSPEAVRVDLGAGTATRGDQIDILVSIEGIWGSRWADHLAGGPDADGYRAGSGADTLVGGEGRDFLYGDFGADTFVIAPDWAAPDIVDDFSPAYGDMLDLSLIIRSLTGYGGTDPFTEGYVRLRPANASTLVEINVDANPAGPWHHVAVLNSVATGSIGPAHIVGGFTPVVLQAPELLLPGTPYSETLQGGAANDTLLGAEGHDVLLGAGGADDLEGGPGDDTLDGASGVDTVRFAGKKTDYAIAKPGADLQVADRVPARDGTDRLVDVERLQFSDKSVAFDLEGNAGMVARLIGAVLGPDAVANLHYVGFGLHQLDQGTSPVELAQIALDASVGEGVADATVVDLLFKNLVGGLPAADVRDHYVALIQSGTFTRASLALFAAGHELNAANIHLVGLATAGIEYLPA